MSRDIGVSVRNAFQRNHFLVVDAGKTKTIGLHQYRPLVDENHSVRTLGENELSEAARVEDLSGLGYCTIPRLYAVRAHGLIDVQKENGVMHRFASLCTAIMQRSDPAHAERWRDLLGSRMADSFDRISATEFMGAAHDLVAAVKDSPLSIEMSDGAIYVTAIEAGAQIFVELETSDAKRAPQLAHGDNMYSCKGSGPVHLIGGVEALILSRSLVRFAEGIKKDTTAEAFADSGMPADAIAAMHMQVTLEDSGAIFLQKGVAVPSLPIPKHGVLMRTIAGGVGVWDNDRLIHVLEANNGTSLLCHPDSGVVQLRATSPEAQILKVPFKLN